MEDWIKNLGEWVEGRERDRAKDTNNEYQNFKAYNEPHILTCLPTLQRQVKGE